MIKSNTLHYFPKPKPDRVVGPGEFSIAAIGLDHGHINGMCDKLIKAGAELKWVYDPDSEKMEAFQKKFPQAKVASSKNDILKDDEIQLVAAAPITATRADLGLEVLDSGKHFFTAKAPFTTLEQLEKAKAKTKETGLKWAVNYSERVAVESAVFAGQLIEEGAIGRVVQVMGTGPHRLNAMGRPKWFFEKELYGGILCDIGSHQIEQFMTFAGAEDAKVEQSKVANYANKKYSELEDFGEASLVADNGAINYFRVDWLTPDGLSSWGDGRTIILGTEGYIELRKNLDVTRSQEGDHLFLVNQQGEKYFSLQGEVGFPYYHDLILDCLNHTEHAMTQKHAFKAAELCLIAQNMAKRIE
ncbi:gfo/Idh/MocA family oxidoreductase [Salibacterium salarium]|uniref:Gfo/Idh/MocA family oxidoreductase n=1 Tax=Salibacterium salarium TaxID=284579 RepID=A0A3R9P7W5_9BACI|nr:Gfo/Idh/MocA family oxidoreductase [Salibacterium salarium]RSL34782.1 gfo/Idh/MocA family oxidoreductase [Salibacterium salarium]